jgi:hypothetical protein
VQDMEAKAVSWFAEQASLRRRHLSASPPTAPLSHSAGGSPVPNDADGSHRSFRPGGVRSSAFRCGPIEVDCPCNWRASRCHRRDEYS